MLRMEDQPFDQPFEIEESAIEEGGSTDERLPLIDLEQEGQRPPSRRKRLLQIGAAVAALVLILVTFHSVLLPARPAAPTQAPAPTTPPPLLLINSNVTGATITINGKRRGTLPMLLPLPYEIDKRQDITVDAPPFQPITCHLPLSDNHLPSGCQQGEITGMGPVTLNGISGSPSHVLYIDFTDDTLPPAQQAQIRAVVTQALETPQQTTVPAGDYFVTDFTGTYSSDDTLSSQRATTPLQASLSVVPNTSMPGPDCNGFICTLNAPFDTAPQQAHLWLILVPVSLRWQFARASGQVISDVPFPASMFMNLALSYNPETGWQVVAPPASGISLSEQLANMSCSTGIQILSDLAGSNSNVGGPNGPNQTIEGCTLSLQSNSNTSLGTFLWRFGVLLAADANAHALLPALPVAPPDELAAAGG
jgi:hypothetical protein